uniref:Gypsy retrotransposon integrase-like protein 1 n=1 Tax=Neogobius melanostomus TaxID=47308 RepID=A0A8C6UNE4_9GOBI
MDTGERVPPTARNELPDLALLLRELNRLELQDDILYRRRHDGEQVSFQLVLPQELKSVVLTSLHDDLGHLGIERTLDLVRTRFFWPRMAADVENKIKTFNRCVRRKALPERSAPLVNIKTTRPLELLCMDYLSLEPDQSNIKDILVFTDHFTKFAIAVPTANQKAKTVAKCLWENFIVCYGIPERLHTDQGPDFESKLIKELCQLAGIVKTRTTPYHPRGNPVERFNWTLLSMLGTLEHKKKAKWKDYVKPLVHAYNCTKNDVTGFTPYELMFGRSPRLPVDLAFGLPVRGKVSTSHFQYVENLRSRLEESFELASKNADKSGERNKTLFDQRVTPSSLEEGDRVLVQNVRLRWKHKLEDKWEQDVYVVVKRAGDLLVYTVRLENRADRPNRTLHRDLLLPCSFLPASGGPDPSLVTPPRRPVTRSQKPATVEHSEDLDEEGEDWNLPQVVIPPITFQFQSSPTVEPAAYSSPVPAVIPVDLVSETVHLLSDEESSVKTGTSLSVEEEEPEPGETLPESVETPPTSEPDEDPPVEEPELLDQVETSPCQNEPLLSPAESPPEAANLHDSVVETTLVSSRPSRQRRPPDRLQYAALGNPLLSVVQTLFHGLVDAYSGAFTTYAANNMLASHVQDV